MKQTIHIIICLFAFVLTANAQKLTVESFKFSQGDLTAQVHARKDLNDKNCALIQVQFMGDITDVEGNVIKPFVKKNNETWVYMTQRTRQMKIITKDYFPLMVTFADYGIEALESGATYVLVVDNPQTSTKPTISNVGYVYCESMSGSVNIYEQPDENSKILDHLKQNGDGAEYVDGYENTRWYKVKYNGAVGYVNKSYSKYDSNVITKTVGNKVYYVVVDKCNKIAEAKIKAEGIADGWESPVFRVIIDDAIEYRLCKACFYSKADAQAYISDYRNKWTSKATIWESDGEAECVYCPTDSSGSPIRISPQDHYKPINK